MPQISILNFYSQFSGKRRRRKSNCICDHIYSFRYEYENMEIASFKIRLRSIQNAISGLMLFYYEAVSAAQNAMRFIRLLHFQVKPNLNELCG
jgi:hypothetical protein